MRFDQVSFPGTHNSGSGFAGSLRRCDGGLESDCIWRNQDLNITAQLELGIRFLEIDTCLLPEGCDNTVYGSLGNSTLFTCYVRGAEIRYAGPISQVFEQINDWMVSNPREIVGLYFPSDYPSTQGDEIYTELKRILESMWLRNNSTLEEPTVSSTDNVYMSTYFDTFGTWPTLEEAISTNERIFVFLANSLSSNLEQTSESPPWISPTAVSTYVKPNQESNICDVALASHAERCNTDGEIVLAVGFTLGVCLTNGQENCNLFLPNATLQCYNLRRYNNRTVNVVLVDYPELPLSSVFEVIRVLNEENIRLYTPPSTMVTPSSDGTTIMYTTSQSKPVMRSVESLWNRLVLYVFIISIQQFFVCFVVV